MSFTLVFVCIFYSCSTLLQALCSVHLDALMSHNDSPQLLRQTVTDAQTCKMLYYPESGLVLILDFKNKGSSMVLRFSKELSFYQEPFSLYRLFIQIQNDFGVTLKSLKTKPELKKYKEHRFFFSSSFIFYTALLLSEFILF